jgi:spermidine synthase
MEAVYPNSDVHVIEIDPGVTEVAHEMLGLRADTSIVTYHEDARTFMDRGPQGAYDLVFGDAFSDFSVPYHLTTKEFNDSVQAWLADGGLYVVNIIDGPYGHFLRAYVYTLRQTFAHVYLAVDLRDWWQTSRSTLVIIATDTPIDRDILRDVDAGDGDAGLGRQLLEDSELDALIEEGRAVALTDRYAPVDQMLLPVFLDRTPR